MPLPWSSGLGRMIEVESSFFASCASARVALARPISATKAVVVILIMTASSLAAGESIAAELDLVLGALGALHDHAQHVGAGAVDREAAGGVGVRLDARHVIGRVGAALVVEQRERHPFRCALPPGDRHLGEQAAGLELGGG